MGLARNLIAVDTATETVSVGVSAAAQFGFAVDTVLVWGGLPGELIIVTVNDFSGTVEVERGALGTTPYPHPAGDLFYKPVDLPDIGAGKLMDMDSFEWPDTVQAVVDTDTAAEFQRSRTISGSFVVRKIQIIAGNTGTGTSGQSTAIRISKGPYASGLDYIEATLAYGQNRGAVATGNMPLADGDVLYAWVADARAAHAKVQLKIMGRG